MNITYERYESIEKITLHVILVYNNKEVIQSICFNPATLLEPVTIYDYGFLISLEFKVYCSTPRYVLPLPLLFENLLENL